jgi:glycosyltransferase 2 family protein
VTPAAKQRVLFGAKIVITAALVGWLVHKGALDMRVLGVFLEEKSLLFLDMFVFVLASIVLASMRWRALLSLVDVKVAFGRAVHLQFVSLFFNVVIPGNVGGDVIKALYVAREQAPEKRASLVLIAFVERLVGLAGLVSVALLVLAFRGVALWENPAFRPFVSTVLLLGAGFVVGPVVFVVAMRSFGAKLEAMASGPSKISGLLMELVKALVLSMGVHSTNMVLFAMMTRIVSKQDAPFGIIATVYPIGLLSLMLPVSAAGAGVGHVAFEKLFVAMGLTRGADVFNVFFFGQIAPCVLGLVPYLMLRAKEPVPEAAPEAAPTEALEGEVADPARTEPGPTPHDP